MSNDVIYFQVILPLKLNWEPWYRSTGSDSNAIHPGRRVRVRFAGKEYIAVVSNISREPDFDKTRIVEFIGTVTGLCDITSKEICFWRQLAAYYLCTVGEVYKYAYPASRISSETKTPKRTEDDSTGMRHHRLNDVQTDSLKSILESHFNNKTVLYISSCRDPLYEEMSRRINSEGLDVLVLEPDNPKESPAVLRRLSKDVRSDKPVTITGSRSCLFLPYHKLGLIIVDDEQSVKYKQHQNPPLFNTRDAALLLANIHSSNVILGSSCPSLESELNCLRGKFCKICEPLADESGTFDIIDTSAEYAKNGMEGSFSRKLLEEMKMAFSRKQRVLLLVTWNDTRDIEIEARRHFPEARAKLDVMTVNKVCDLSKYALVCVVRGEYLLSRNDFRADEKALRLLLQLKRALHLIIQTSESNHPVWKGDDIHNSFNSILEERRLFNYPPFTRLVEVRFDDDNEKRRLKLASEFQNRFGATQFFFKKDSNLQSEKSALAVKVAAFEEDFKYKGHITIDVDPI